MKYFFLTLKKYMFEILLLLLSQLIFRKICRILFETIKKNIYIFLFIYFKNLFFPQPCVSPNWEFLYPTVHCGIFAPKNRTKVAFGQKNIAIPVQKLLYSFKNTLRNNALTFFSPPPSIFSSFLIEEIARPSSKVNRVCHAFLQQRSRTIRQLPSTQLSPTDRQTWENSHAIRL